jgi:hypothetical protein
MTQTPFTPPTFDSEKFNCPHCRAFSRQRWYVNWAHSVDGHGSFEVKPLKLSLCEHCDEACYWLEGKLAFPRTRTAPPPNQDLSTDIKRIYEEAAGIAAESPKGAAALLRLCIQMLCADLGESGKNINNDVAALVARGLPVEIQQALDVVRVVGNNAVHPGEIIVDDQPDTVAALFTLLNVIADRMITHPKQIEALYGNLPGSIRDAIAKRDKNRT